MVEAALLYFWVWHCLSQPTRPLTELVQSKMGGGVGRDSSHRTNHPYGATNAGIQRNIYCINGPYYGRNYRGENMDKRSCNVHNLYQQHSNTGSNYPN
jgi:hypothetical protein